MMVQVMAQEMARAKGFTLLEILVALAIVAVGTAAVMQSISSTSRTLHAAEKKMLATWLASDRIAELRLAHVWPSIGGAERNVTAANQVWHYREEFSATADPDVMRVDVSVYDDADKTYKNAEMFAYLTRPTPPVSANTQ